jgi:two-component sensor histidine kinase
VADRVVALTGELGTGDTDVRVQREGSFGQLPPELATPLALVLVELVQNAVEHGLAGRDGEVRVSVAAGGPDRLVVTVADDGAGLPAGFDLLAGAGLGLQIVRTLVEGELGGTLTVGPGDPGTRVTLDLPTLPPER